MLPEIAHVALKTLKTWLDKALNNMIKAVPPLKS